MLKSPRRGSFKVAALGEVRQSIDDEALSVASDDTLSSTSGLMRRRQTQIDSEFVHLYVRVAACFLRITM